MGGEGGNASHMSLRSRGGKRSSIEIENRFADFNRIVVDPRGRESGEVKKFSAKKNVVKTKTQASRAIGMLQKRSPLCPTSKRKGDREGRGEKRKKRKTQRRNRMHN